MRENKRYYWLKLKDDFFTSKRIKKLRKLAGGDTFTIIYLKMQLLSIKSDGVLYYTGLEETFAEELALDIDEDPDNVAVTINYLIRCNLLQSSDNVEFELPFVKANIGSETASSQRSREFRERQKVLHCNTSATQVQRKPNVEKEIEIEKDINNKSGKHDLNAIHSVIDYLNEICGTHYRYTDKNVGLVKARMNDGFTVDDFKTVIEVKFDNWNRKPDMRQYLRPQTLFGTKFEAYLNQKGVGNGRVESVSSRHEITDEQLEIMRNGSDEDREVSDLWG